MKKIYMLILSLIILIFITSTVNAGIFEFAEDSEGNSYENDYDVDEVDEQPIEDDFEIMEFQLNSLKSKDVLDEIIDLQNYIDNHEDSNDFETVFWLTELQNNILFDDDEGDKIIVNESEVDKIPSSSKYSSCVIECKVIDTHYGEESTYYLVKDIKVLKKTKKETKSSKSSSSKSSSSKSSYTYVKPSSSKSSSDYSKSSSNDNEIRIHYIGNAATGKFHAETCRDVNKIKSYNVVDLYGRDEAINRGYNPCGHCRP